MLGEMCAVPSRETVAAFVFLAHIAFANGMDGRFSSALMI